MASRHRFLIDGAERTVNLEPVPVAEGAPPRYRITIDDGAPFEVDASVNGIPGLVATTTDGRPSRAYVARRTQGFDVTVAGRTFEVRSAVGTGRGRGTIGGAEDPIGKVTAPLAGVVVSVHVKPGDTIEVGQLLVVVEAMKMQNEIHAPHAGTVTAVQFEAGARCERHDLLVEYTPTEA